MVITSRQKIDRLFTVSINSLSEKYCYDMYIKASESFYTESERETAKEILKLADFHTQTIELIAKAQYSLGYTPNEMYNALIESGFTLKGISEEIDTEDFTATMAVHMTKIFNLLNIHDDEQLKTIKLFSLLAPNEIIYKQKVKEWFGLENLNSINQLINYVWLTGEGRMVFIHPVISDVIRYMDCPDFEFASELVDSLNAEMESADDYTKRNDIIVHCVSAAKVLECENEDFAYFIHNIGVVYYSQGEYSKALEYYEKDLAISEKILGTEHPDTAATYNNIALLYKKQGEYAKALEYYNKDLAISKEVLGEKHPHTATIYNNIACLYKDTNDYIKALEYFKIAYNIWVEAYGPEHELTVRTINRIKDMEKILEEKSKHNEKTVLSDPIETEIQDATTSYSESEIIEKLRRNGLSEEQIKQLLKS